MQRGLPLLAMDDAVPTAADPRALATDPALVRRRLEARLDPVTAAVEGLEELRPAAVLIPVVRVDDRPHLMFLRRPQSMREHSGQIAFPGGRLEAGESPLEAALREAEEELGIVPDRLEVLGRDAGIPTITRYFVHPIVAWFDAPPELRPNPGEVEETFYADLPGLLDPAIYDGRLVESDGCKRVIHYFHYGHPDGRPRIIWGATGRLLAGLFGRVFDWTPPGEHANLPSAS